MPNLVGTNIDKYAVLDEVGHGGMAVVYRGRDTVLEREVAVKVLHSHLADREESRLRLQREALAVAKLRHDNILAIYDYSGPGNQESYIVTEFIHGITLKQWMDAHPTPRPAVAALIVHRLCLALCHAHRGGIVHRDIKPENVMIRHEDGCLKLMDFGIAQILDNQKLTMTGQLLGSPAYMAPELITGRPLDRRTDLFSLGILLYQLSTGALPFAGRNPHEVLNRIADGEYPAPSSVCRLVDPELEEILRKALATSPDDRFQTSEAFAAELEAYLKELELEPTPDEIRQYFRNPDAYVAELDRRLCNALLLRAQQVAREGHVSKAIRLLGRVLDVDPEHKAARWTLLRLRRRERRVRQLLLGTAGLGGVGLLVAGVLLVAPGTPAGGQDGPEDPAGEGRRADVVVPLTAEAQAPRASAPTPRMEDARDKQIAKAAAKIGRPTSPLQCKVKIVGVNPNQITQLKIQVGSRSPAPLKTDVYTFEPTRENEPLTVDGARYSGMLDVSRTDCARGEPIPFKVMPKPASVVITNPTPDLVMTCDAGCADRDLGRNLDPSKPLIIPLGEDSERDVHFTFKRKGYEHEPHKRRIVPGENRFPAPELKPD